MAMDTVNGHELPVDGNINTLSGSAEIAALVAANRIFAAAINTSGEVDSSGVEGALAITSADAAALAAGLNGATNPALQVDASTASSATGIKVKSAAATAGVAVSVISSETNENLTVDAKGSGTISLNATGTGKILVNRSITMADAMNIECGASTGLKLGTSATAQKIGLFNATPVVQPVGANQADITVTAGTYGFNSAAAAASIVTLLKQIRSDLVTLGVIKGAA